MKIEVKSYSSIGSLISSILFLILGAVMFTNPDEMVTIFSQVLGGIIAVYGFYKCIKNYTEVKKDNSTSSFEMALGIGSIIVGLGFIFLAKVIETLVRFIIGGWILFSGINRLINSIYMSKKSSKFIALFLISLLLIGGGLYTILESNLAFKYIGLVLILYSVLEIIGYIFNKKEAPTTKVSVDIKEKEVIDAIVIEDKSSNKLSKKKNK